MTRPRLHPPLFLLRYRVRWAFDFIRVPGVPFVGLDPLARVKEMTQYLVEDFNVGVLTGGVWALDPHQVPTQNTHPQLVAEGGLAGVLV